METLVNYILRRSTRCSSVQNTYILSTPPGWLGGMLILMPKAPNIYLQRNNKIKLKLK